MGRSGFRSSEMDLTQGSIPKQLFALWLPIVLGLLVQSLYTMADSAVVGRVVGDTALAAVGCSTNVSNFLLFVFSGIGTGAGVVISQYFGAKQEGKLKNAVHGSIFLSLVVSVVTAAAGIFLTGPMLVWLNTPEHDGTLRLAVTYMRVLLLGLPATALYNLTGGVLRSVGDSKTPFYFLLIASVMNIILDILFVAGFQWGVGGAAFATIIAQAFSAVLGIIKLMRTKAAYALVLREIRWYGDECAHVMKVGLPMGLQGGILTLGMLVLQGTLNSFGSTVMAGFTIGTRFDMMFLMPPHAFQQAHIVHVGQNIGAKNLDRVNKSVKYGAVAAFIYGMLLIPFVYVCGPFFLRIFSDSDAVIVEGMKMLKTIAPFYWTNAMMNAFSSTYRGAGYTLQGFAISLFTCFFGRIAVGLLVVRLTGDVAGIYYGIAADFVLAMILNFLYGAFGSWRKKVLQGAVFDA